MIIPLVSKPQLVSFNNKMFGISNNSFWCLNTLLLLIWEKKITALPQCKKKKKNTNAIMSSFILSCNIYLENDQSLLSQGFWKANKF